MAVAVFALGSFALATILIDANINTRLNSERLSALTYAREGIEAVRAIRSESWDSLSNGLFGLSFSDAGWVFEAEPDVLDDKYIRTVTVSDTDPFSTSTKNISVSVSWSITPIRSATTTLFTVLTNWKQL